MNTNYVSSFHKKYSTAILADAAFRAGVDFGVAPAGISPLDVRSRLAGPAVTVAAHNDLVGILAAVEEARAGQVVVISNPGSAAAVIGDLIGAEAVRKGLAGFVVDGWVRDHIELVEMGLPVFCIGTYPIGPLKLLLSRKGLAAGGVSLEIGDCLVRAGDWVFGDADGVLCVAPDHLEVVFHHAGQAWEREEALLREIRAGKSLGELLHLGEFLEKRRMDPTADFNTHLAESGRAI